MCHFHSVRRTSHILILAFVGISAAGLASADTIELTNGGRLEGKMVPSDESNKSNFVIELTAGGKLTIPRSQVASLDPATESSTEYKKLARSSPDTVAAHLKLAEWCRQHKLQADGQRHLERIVELDANNAEARAALGFREKDGRWMNRDDVMASRGLVLYKGTYVTPQQVELIERQQESRVVQADWAKRIAQLRSLLTSRRTDRLKGRDELLAIKDPAAADAVVGMLRRENDPDLKGLWVEVASHINSRVTLDALVDLSLTDPDDDIRHQCLELLIKSGRPGIATPYVRALKNKENEFVNRAAAALGQIRDPDSIGPLIDALITTHKMKVGDSNPDQHAYSFSKDSSAFSFGSGGPKIVSQSVRNRAVLDALLTMSGGVSFDYDQVQWRNWLAAQAKATAVDVRRDQ